MRRESGFWEETIYTALRALGGEVYTTDIYEWINNNITLTERELSESPHQGRPYFVNAVRGIASDMCNKGSLVRVHNGKYSLP
jgi:hypothetical protein